jgi:23S rRNA (cytidine1920-2'-O)/16S rRNA (cytidine1409-2'-O)-methyltransferase
VKPQFEAGREQVGKNGIVRDKEIHRSVLRSVVEYAGENGLSVEGVTYSPITGTKGNIEFLMLLQKDRENDPAVTDLLIDDTVDQAHESLDRR